MPVDMRGNLEILPFITRGDAEHQIKLMTADDDTEHSVHYNDHPPEIYERELDFMTYT